MASRSQAVNQSRETFHGLVRGTSRVLMVIAWVVLLATVGGFIADSLFGESAVRTGIGKMLAPLQFLVAGIAAFITIGRLYHHDPDAVDLMQIPGVAIVIATCLPAVLANPDAAIEWLGTALSWFGVPVDALNPSASPSSTRLGATELSALPFSASLMYLAYVFKDPTRDGRITLRRIGRSVIDSFSRLTALPADLKSHNRQRNLVHDLANSGRLTPDGVERWIAYEARRIQGVLFDNRDAINLHLLLPHLAFFGNSLDIKRDDIGEGAFLALADLVLHFRRFGDLDWAAGYVGVNHELIRFAIDSECPRRLAVIAVWIVKGEH